MFGHHQILARDSDRLDRLYNTYACEFVLAVVCAIGTGSALADMGGLHRSIARNG